MATTVTDQPGIPVRTPEDDQKSLNQYMDRELQSALGTQVSSTPTNEDTELEIKAGDSLTDKIERVGVFHNPRPGFEPSKTLKGMVAEKAEKMTKKVFKKGEKSKLDPNI
jgi:hypothetical protein